MPMTAFSGYREAGMSLVELMIAMGIAAIAMALLSTLVGTSLRAHANTKAAMAMEQVRFDMRMNFDCQATVATMPSPCPAGRGVNLRGASRVMAAAAPATTTYVDLEVQAVCTGRPREFRVSARRGHSGPFEPLFNVDLVCP